MRTAHNGLADCLLELARTDDAEAWCRVAELSSECLRRAARGVLPDESRVEDAVQEALLEIRRQAHRFAPQGSDADGAAYAWIRALGRFTALRMLRGDRRRIARERAQPCRTVADVRGIDDVRVEVERLPAVLRESIELRYGAGLDYHEAAQALHVTETTLRKRVERGLARLRSRLKDLMSLGIAGIGGRHVEWNLSLKGGAAMKWCAGSVAVVVATAAVCMTGGRAGAEEVKVSRSESVAVAHNSEKYVFNGNEVSREEFERLSKAAKRSFDEMASRMAEVAQSGGKEASSHLESYVFNGKPVTKDEYERLKDEANKAMKEMLQRIPAGTGSGSYVYNGRSVTRAEYERLTAQTK